jgi:tetratricopeptide (TPR) repeat protein
MTGFGSRAKTPFNLSRKQADKLDEQRFFVPPHAPHIKIMGFAGELTTIGLGEVFQNVAFNRLTGVLTVTDRDREAEVCMQDGRVCAFRHGDGRKLDYPVIAERIGAADPETIRTAARRRRRRTLRAVLAKGTDFSEQQYDLGVKQAVEEEVILIFGWKTASFRFDEGRADADRFDKDQLECKIAIDPQAISMEAARRLDEWDGISRQISSEREIFVATQEASEELPVDAARVLGLLDGTNDVRAVLEQSDAPKFQIMKTVAELIENGWATQADGEHLRNLARSAQAAGETDRAVRYLESSLDREAGDLEARTDLARLYEKLGQKKDAAREHKRLAYAYEEQNELKTALECYERASVLVPYDTDTLQHIAGIHESRGEKVEFTRSGRRLAEAFAAQSLNEEARDVYKRLVESDGENIALREALAGLHIKLHEPKEAAAELLVLARRAWSTADFQSALRCYRSVLAVDRECQEARTRIAEIESGRARQRRQRRFRRLFFFALTVIVSLLGWQSAREWQGSDALHRATVSATGSLASAASDESILAALEQFAVVANEHPYTRAAVHAKQTVRSLLVDTAERAKTAARVDPAAADELLTKIDRLPMPDDLRDEWAELRPTSSSK